VVCYSFCQNYLHDAESLWWIACWFLLATHPVEEQEEQEEHKELQSLGRRRLYDHFFPADILKRGIPSQNPFIRPPDPNPPFGPPDSAVLPAAYQRSFNFVLNDSRDLLVERYRKAEAPEEFDASAMDDVFQEAFVIWRGIGIFLGNTEFKFNDYFVSRAHVK